MNPSEPNDQPNNVNLPANTGAPTPEAPSVETDQPGPVLPTSQPKPNGSKKKIIMMIAVVILLLMGGAAAYFLTREDGGQAENSYHSGAENHPGGQENEEKPVDGDSTKTYVFSSGLANRPTVSFEYPASWVVSEKAEHEFNDGSSLRVATVGSSQGHYMHLFDIDGIGGHCHPNEESYTLVKKLSTKTTNLFLTEYRIDGDPEQGYLKPERFNTEFADADHEALKEGDKGQNSCFAGKYPDVADNIFMHLTSSADRDDSSGKRLGYDDIKDDSEFLKVIQSLKVVDRSQD